MKKDYSDWEVVEDNDAPDYSSWELVQEPGGFAPAPTPPPSPNPSSMPAWIRAIDSFNKGPATTGFRTGVERTTQGLMQALMPNNPALKDIAAEREADYAQSYKRDPISSLLGNVAGGIGSTLPTALAGGSVASQAIPSFGPILGNALAAGTEAGLFGASQYVNKGESRAGNTLKSALAGGAGSAALGGLGQLAKFSGLGQLAKGLKNNLYPSAGGLAQKYGNELPIEQLLANQQAAKGTQTPLGRILGSSELSNKFENKLVPGIGSGGANKLGQIEAEVTGKVNNVFNKIGGENLGSDTNQLTKDLVQEAFKKQTKAKNTLYENVSNLASKESFNLDLPKFSGLASDTADALKEGFLAKSDPQFKRILNRVTNLDQGAKASSPVTLKEAQILANKLNSEGRKSLNSSATSDRFTGDLYIKLGNALKDDIKQEVATRGSTELQQALSAADANYKKNFASFLDKDVYKLLGENKSAESIVREIIKPSKAHDKYQRITKIQNLLPEEQKNILGYTYLQPALNREGDLQVKKLNSLLDALGNRQFKALFPDKAVRDELRDVQKLIGMNSEALNRMFNPKTGGRLQGDLSRVKDLVAGSVSGSLLGPVGSAVTLGATAARNRGMTNNLTNEEFRNAVISEILNKAKNGAQASKAQPVAAKVVSTVVNDKRRDK